MFANLRHALKDLAGGVIPPSQRNNALSRMRDTLVQARMALADMSAALDQTRDRFALEQRELETVRRRLAMAEQIGDSETVAVARRFEEKHARHLEVLSRKLAAQEEELRLAEAEVAAMTAELKAVPLGGAATGQSEAAAAAREVDEVLGAAEELRRDIDGLARKRSRQALEAEAEERLAELKRKMQK